MKTKQIYLTIINFKMLTILLLLIVRKFESIIIRMKIISNLKLIDF